MPVVECLLARRASLDGKDANLQSPLHCAALENHAGMCARLLQARANVDLADASGRSSLMRAEDRQHGEAMRVLASRGAELVPEAAEALVKWLRGKSVTLHGLRAEELNGKRGPIVGRGEGLRLGVAVGTETRARSVQPWNLALENSPCFPDDVVAILRIDQERTEESAEERA